MIKNITKNLDKFFKKVIDKLKDEKTWMIIITILIILFVIYYYFGFSLFGSHETNQRKNIDKLKIKENFENGTQQNTVQYPKNLITNGSFENGNKPSNYIDQSGSNKIINFSNPSFSPYVLQQTQTDELTFYALQSYCEDNSKYMLLLWTSFRNLDGSKPVENIDLSKILNVRILKKDSNNIPTISYKIIQKVNLQDDVDSWYLVSFNWSTPGDTDNLMNIYLNYTATMQSTYQYFTGLKLYKVLPEAENFIYNDKLNLYLDGYHATASSKVWNDNSTYGNDFNWKTNPSVNQGYGFVNTNNNTLSGRTSTQILGEGDSSFTFVLVMSKENTTSTTTSTTYGTSAIGYDETTSEETEAFNNGSYFEDSLNTKTVLLIPGNTNYSVKVDLDIVKNRFIVSLPNSSGTGGSGGATVENLVLNNETMISFVYTTGGTFKMYQDGNELLSIKCDKLYYSNTDQIQIIPNSDINMNLYAVLNYQRVVEKEELQLIRNYFLQNKNKDFTQISINTQDTDYSNLFYKSDWSTVSAYNKRDPNQAFTGDNLFLYKYGNQSSIYQINKANCLPLANELCQAFIDDVNKYQDCMRNAKNVLPACKNYCNDSANKNSLLCEPDKCDSEDSEVFDEKKDCPLAYKRFNNFMVNIKPNTYYAKEYQYSGEKSYGQDLQNARTMYMMNFPKCKLPENLKPGEGKNTIEQCPYIIHEGNPCYQSVCAGVEWNESNYKNLNMSDKCKKAVSYYCQINADLDDMCKCWKEENKENPKCVEYRKFFENPLDYCPPSAFNIEDHPNMNQYIKKDKIPCFGCKVE